MTHHGKFRSDDPDETNWKSSDLLHDSTPYYNEQMNGHTNNNDSNPSEFYDNNSPNYGDDNTQNNQQKWSRTYQKQNAYNNNSSNFNGFKSGMRKRGGIDRSAFPPSFRNKYNNNRRGRGLNRGGFRGRGYRGRGRGYYRSSRGSRGRGYPRFRGSRGRGRGSFRGGPRRFRNRKPTTKEDLDRDLDKYLYGGDDGEQRKKVDLDDDLDSYWNDSNTNVKKGDNEKEEMDATDGDKKENEGDKVEDEEKNDDKGTEATDEDNEKEQ